MAIGDRPKPLKKQGTFRTNMRQNALEYDEAEALESGEDDFDRDTHGTAMGVDRARYLDGLFELAGAHAARLVLLAARRSPRPGPPPPPTTD